MARVPRGLILWISLCVLLAFGLLTTTRDLLALPDQETRRANETNQRVIIDPETGQVSGLAGGTEISEAFDVAEAGEETSAEASETPASETPHEAEAPAAQEPASAETAEVPETPATAEQPAPAEGSSLRTEPVVTALPTVERGTHSLVPAPAPEITETKGKLKLPKKGEHEAAASKLYAKSFSRREEHILLSFVILDAGFNADALALMLELPSEVSVAVSPYAREPNAFITALRNAGHEVWTMLPAQGSKYPQDDPGPMGITNNLSTKEAVGRAQEVMAEALGSVGFVLPPSEAISPQTEPWGSVLKEIEARGLLLLSTNGTRSVDQLSADEKLRAIIKRADLVLDSTPGSAFIHSKLAGLNEQAKAQGELVVVAYARPLTLRILSEWLKEKKLDPAITLAPVTALWQPKVPPPLPEPEGGGHGGGHGGEEKKESGGHGGGH